MGNFQRALGTAPACRALPGPPPLLSCPPVMSLINALCKSRPGIHSQHGPGAQPISQLFQKKKLKKKKKMKCYFCKGRSGPWLSQQPLSYGKSWGGGRWGNPSLSDHSLQLLNSLCPSRVPPCHQDRELPLAPSKGRVSWQLPVPPAPGCPSQPVPCPWAVKWVVHECPSLPELALVHPIVPSFLRSM